MKNEQRRAFSPQKCKKEVATAAKKVEPKVKTSMVGSSKKTYQLAITGYLAENKRCRNDYVDSFFRILGLDVLEALYTNRTTGLMH